MKKDRKKMWQVVCLFVLSMILSGTFGAMGAEADAKAYEFIIPDVDIEYLSSADIQDMPLQVVCYAKNEIYARHGRMFQSQELTNYFEEQLCMAASVPLNFLLLFSTSTRRPISNSFLTGERS